MAEDLDKKMEPEISEAAEKAAEVIKEEVSVAEEKAAEKVAEAAEAAKDTAAATAAAATAVTATAAKEAEAAAKAAKKAEEQAAKEAAKRQAQAEKEAEKARIAKEKAEAKLEKKRQKKAAEMALIDSCPAQYKPVSTSKYFWLAFLSAIPVIGFIATFILSIAGRNRNVKNFEGAILAYYIIGLVICLIAIIVVGICLPATAREAVINFILTLTQAIKFG